MTMHVCPRGHQSQAGDYCDECGAPIGGSGGSGGGRSNSSPGTPASAITGSGDADLPVGPPCPECGSPRAGRFCEVCGYDFVLAKLSGGAATPNGASASAGSTTADSGVPVGDSLPKRPATAVATGIGWALAVSADATYHARMQAIAEAGADPIAFPVFVPPRRFTLSGAQVLVGRRSRSRGIEPEVDLSGPPADPAVSHAHALLLAQPDGFWAVVDLDSANGTYINDSLEAIEPNTPRLLDDGDRIYVGAWTMITLTRLSA